ncbi:ATP-dependent helicase [Vibrio rotiferianus]|uniref:UvrD-helicase domain-containing protein n=1 Tax=Vibrio rotiferianus TaxID=190895 RepID=UPI00111057CB|nr:UvrD-helicase domain-containing protein [Vibrio rotiferianus]TMX33475.1 ATP-dependent helicase [Vibrio rotiferianus]TMX48253.1 ATP-dependent helicase [Vibrio rotiferianus]TMX64143.1 ATP-dependent helicase [Vibrio rotiferianus]
MTDVTTSASIDDDIYSCLNLDAPKSFFLFAGAGSGKTRSLVEVLKRFREHNVHRLRANAQQVAIITYTNAACDEIKRRLEFDPSFSVSTIHSFVWELIKPHPNDIREILRVSLQADIEKLEDAQRRGRAGTKAAEDRPRQIASKQKRLDSLDRVQSFSYNPNGENVGRDSLNHTDVIGIAVELLISKPLLQRILIRKFPVLLVDESQDTKKDLIEALFVVQASHKEQFSMGLFGDVMQRIYFDGKEHLDQDLPDDWLKPKKEYNYRSPRRIVRLINKIREDVDHHIQLPAKDKEGFVRLFIADSRVETNKAEFEYSVCQEMAKITEDKLWIEDRKTLTLEHHMAAVRGGFSSFFDPLYKVEKLKTSLLDGTHACITLFSERVLPLINSLEAGNQFAISRIINKYSPLISPELLQVSSSPREELAKAKRAVDSLYALWDGASDPSLHSILKEVHRSGLFPLPEILAVIAARKEEKEYQESDAENDLNPTIEAWDNALKAKFSELKEYVQYISDESEFGTHQGIKGLEFPRVMVILDDKEARGTTFSYGKLFGAEPLTSSDLRNQQEGRDTGIDRTKRLFYVTCSRAEESLAIIAYTDNPTEIARTALQQGWFDEGEIINIPKTVLE